MATQEDNNFSDKRKDLFIASSYGDADIVQKLLDKGDNTNIVDKNGNTPLHGAVQAGHIDIVDLLLKNGANVNITNTNGYTPLYIAIEKERPDIVELLLKNGAKISFESKPYTTPIHYIAIYKYNKIGVELLNVFIENKVNINEQDINGYTPLHIASTNNNYEIANVLIENNDNLDIKTDSGKTALDIATEKNHLGIIDLLKNAALKTGKSNPVENNLKKDSTLSLIHI
jgi:ankyrin repeat protein